MVWSIAAQHEPFGQSRQREVVTNGWFFITRQPNTDYIMSQNKLKWYVPSIKKNQNDVCIMTMSKHGWDRQKRGRTDGLHMTPVWSTSCVTSILFFHNFDSIYIHLRRSRDVFVPSSVPSFLRSPRFSSLWPAFTLIVHIHPLYPESVHGREEHATWINTIPLKIATLLTLQSLKWAYTVGTDVLTVGPIRDESPLFRYQTPGAPDVSVHDHFGTECRSKRKFGYLIRYSSLRL